MATLRESYDDVSWSDRAGAKFASVHSNHHVPHRNCCGFAVGGNVYAAYFNDGFYWQYSDELQYASAIASLNGRFVALTAQGGVLTSSLAGHWHGYTTVTRNQLFAAAAEGEDLYLVGQNGTILKGRGAARLPHLAIARETGTNLLVHVEGLPGFRYVVENGPTLFAFSHSGYEASLDGTNSTTISLPISENTTFLRLREY